MWKETKYSEKGRKGYCLSLPLTTILVVLLINTNGNCQQNNASVVGKWIFDYDLAIAGMSAPMKAKYDDFDPAQQERVMHYYQGRTFTFHQDNTFLMKLPNGQMRTGTWQYNSGSKELTMNDPGGKVMVFDVVVITPVKMILRYADGGSDNRLFDQWFLKSAQN